MILKLLTVLTLVNCFDVGDFVFLNSDVFGLEIEKALEVREQKATKCTNQLRLFLEDVRSRQMWALNMLDASSKIPSGVLAGNIADLGSFDQCLDVEHDSADGEKILGKFCHASMPLSVLLAGLQGISGKFLEKSMAAQNLKRTLLYPQTKGVMSMATGNPQLTLSWCVPSGCTAEDLNNLLQIVPLENKLGISIHSCQSKADTDDMTAGDWAFSAVLIIILVIILVSTVFDIYSQHVLKKKVPPYLILVAFSVYSNGLKLIATSQNPNQLPCLNGIRFLSMMWVILGHTYYSSFYSPSVNTMETLKWMEKLPSMLIIGATVSVDTFFVLGGLLMVYSFMLSQDNGIRFNIPMYYVHRYIRLTPALAAAVVLHITVLRFVGSGPYWPDIMSSLEVNCSKYWWSVLLYVQNYVNPNEQCLGQTWYLSVDMQLFLLSPLILLPLRRWPRWTMYGLAVLLALSVISPFTIAYVDEMPGLIPQSMVNPNYMSMYYINTYARFGPWIVGIILGYYVYKRKENTKLNQMLENKLVNLAGWALSIVVLLLVIYGPNTMWNHPYDRWESSIFLALHRTAWGIALAWIIYVCIIGKGGIINWFLSLSMFQILARLTYSTYLLHLSLQFMRVGQLRVPKYFSDTENFYAFFGDLFFSSFMAVLWTLTFESPIIVIEKIIFGQGNKRSATKSEPILPTTEK